MIEKVEERVRKVEDAVLLMHQDLRGISGAMDSMSKSLEKLADVQATMKVMEERCESRHIQHKDAEKRLHARLDDVEVKTDHMYTVATISVPNIDKGLKVAEEKLKVIEPVVFFMRYPKITIAVVGAFYALAFQEVRNLIIGG